MLGSFRDAGRGVVWMVRHQRHMRFHLLAATTATALGLALRLGLDQWVAVVFAILAVLLAETVNSAIEAVLDLVQPAQDPTVGVVKDLAAGAVLVAATAAAVIGALVYVPALVHGIRP